MLSKKKSRPITVGNEKYRWAIAPDGQWVTLVVQDHQINGQKLEIVIQVHFSQINPDTGETIALPMRIVKPALVAELIEKALQFGWQPKAAHPPLELTLQSNDELKLRRGLVD